MAQTPIRQTDSDKLADKPADLVAARRRSDLYGVDPSSTTIPYVGEPRPAAEALKKLSTPILEDLLSRVADSSLALVMADQTGRLIYRDAPTRSTRAFMTDRSLDVGFSLAEADTGTNGVGTSLETRRPVVVAGDEHHLEWFHGFTCANAPVVQPITGKIEATVGLVCPVEDTESLLLATAIRLSEVISQEILAQAKPGERFLLEEFLRRRRSAKRAIATVGDGVLIATPAAQRHLSGVDQVELWDQVQAVTRSGSSADLSLPAADGRLVGLRCHPLFRAGELGGAAIEFVSEAGQWSGPKRRSRRVRGRRLGELVGGSVAWQTVVDEAVAAADHSESILIVGERGTGRLSIAEAIIDLSGADRRAVLDSADVALQGDRVWLAKARTAVAESQAVVLRRVDQLPDPVAAGLAALVASPARGARVVATTESLDRRDPGLAALMDQLDVVRIDVPPLRDRRGDIGELVHHLGCRTGRGDLDPTVVGLLSRQRWPGNVTELTQVLRSAHARARGGRITVGHLPRRVQLDDRRRPLHGLRQQEADAIVAALNSTSTRVEAARLLGISRATLYRRINAYGLELGE